MSLHQYEIDFSPLSLDEKTALIERIKDNAFTRLQWKLGFQSASFLVDEDFKISSLNVPAECRLSLIL